MVFNLVGTPEGWSIGLSLHKGSCAKQVGRTSDVMLCAPYPSLQEKGGTCLPDRR